MDDDDIWEDFFEDSFESLNNRIEKLFSSGYRACGPDVKTYGYTAFSGPDGKMHIREFGNAVGNSDRLRSIGSPATSEPFTDVTLENGKVSVIVELPGAAKEDIVLKSGKNAVSVSVDNGYRRFDKTLALPCDVNVDSVRAEYNNGILEVTFDSLESGDAMRTIDIL